MFSTLQTTIDLPLAHAFQGAGSAWLTELMQWISLVFSPGVLMISALFITLYFWEHHDRHWGTKIFYLISGNVFILILKELWGRPRPDPTAVSVRVHEYGFSFPSGHAIAVVLFAAVVLLTLRHLHRPSYRVAWWVLAALVLLVGWSRLYLGVHWFSDVVGGYLVAGAWIAVCVVGIWPTLDRSIQHINAPRL
ncbi:MAG: phosphatase PAP2 family protein [Candidatus Kerfeldbacteria bacterium]|nr:phosphatase PAP2 family protein [Candidatus Kerfeldbacteria bacterium]